MRSILKYKYAIAIFWMIISLNLAKLLLREIICLKNNLYLRIKTEPVTDAAVATVYTVLVHVWHKNRASTYCRIGSINSQSYFSELNE